MGKVNSHPIIESELSSISFSKCIIRHISLDSTGHSLAPPSTNSLRTQLNSRPSSLDFDQNTLLLDDSTSIIYENTENLQLVLQNYEGKFFLMKFYNFTEYTQIKDQVRIRTLLPWQYTNYCVLCQRKFNYIRRQHHCRICGKSICKQCYDYFKIPSVQYSKPQKVCVSCKAKCIDKQVKKRNLAKQWEEILKKKL